MPIVALSKAKQPVRKSTGKSAKMKPVKVAKGKGGGGKRDSKGRFV